MRIGLAQIVSGADPEANLALVTEYAETATADGAELVVFPEATMRAFGHPLGDVAEPLDGPWGNALRALADRLGVTIVAGMFTPGNDGRVRNTLAVASAAGVVGYDKIHLFDAFGFEESRTVDGGERPVTVDIAGVTVGLATCYDIRFPDLFTANARAGARVHLIGASWGAGPGKLDQWELLARARALDTTSIVVAVGQGDPVAAGVAAVEGAPTGVGGSLVVSPLGEVLHRLGAAPELVVVDLDLAAVDAARASLPVLDNRRDGLL